MSGKIITRAVGTQSTARLVGSKQVKRPSYALRQWKPSKHAKQRKAKA